MNGIHPRRKTAILITCTLTVCLLAVVLVPGQATAVKKRWTKTFDYDGGFDTAEDVAVAPNGSIYLLVAGNPQGGGTSHHLRKYSPTGKLKWFKDYAGDGVSVLGMAVAPNGAVYVAGYIWRDGEGYSAWLRKYTSKGKAAWTKEYDDKGVYWFRDIAASPDGFLYIAGTNPGLEQGMNLWLGKMNLKGKVIWSRTYDNSLPTQAINEEAQGVTVAPYGSIYVCGMERNNPTTGDNVFVARYTSKGKRRWVSYYNHLNKDDWGYGVAASAGGPVYVAADAGKTDSLSGNDILLLKYSKKGKFKWGKLKNGSGNSQDKASDLVVGPDGTIYVAGSIHETGEQSNVWLGKFNSKGVEKWSKTYDGGTGNYEYGKNIAMAPDGSMYVVGYVSVGEDAWIAKYK